MSGCRVCGFVSLSVVRSAVRHAELAWRVGTSSDETIEPMPAQVDQHQLARELVDEAAPRGSIWPPRMACGTPVTAEFVIGSYHHLFRIGHALMIASRMRDGSLSGLQFLLPGSKSCPHPRDLLQAGSVGCELPVRDSMQV